MTSYMNFYLRKRSQVNNLINKYLLTYYLLKKLTKYRVDVEKLIEDVWKREILYQCSVRKRHTRMRMHPPGDGYDDDDDAVNDDKCKKTAVMAIWTACKLQAVQNAILNGL